MVLEHETTSNPCKAPPTRDFVFLCARDGDGFRRPLPHRWNPCFVGDGKFRDDHTTSLVTFGDDGSQSHPSQFVPGDNKLSLLQD